MMRNAGFERTGPKLQMWFASLLYRSPFLLLLKRGEKIASGSNRLGMHLSLCLIAFAILVRIATAQTTDRLTTMSPQASRLDSEKKVALSIALALREAADRVNDFIHIGTMYNEVDIPRHTCYALGTLLDRERHVSHLQFKRDLRPVAGNLEEAQELRVAAQSLDNFASAVGNVTRMKQDQRAQIWNLDCVGQMQIPISSFVPQTVTTSYEVTEDGKGLRVLGDIDAGFAKRLQREIEANPKIEYVSLGSGGGAVYEALLAGRYLRARGLMTTVWNNCYSACPLVFAGGKERHIRSPYPSLGFHQIYAQAGPAPLDSEVYRDTARYLTDMGVVSSFVLANMLSAKPQEMRLISGGDVPNVVEG